MTFIRHDRAKARLRADVPAIHVLKQEDVDARDGRGHDAAFFSCVE
jgi:hypothetical protein